MRSTHTERTPLLFFLFLFFRLIYHQPQPTPFQSLGGEGDKRTRLSGYPRPLRIEPGLGLVTFGAGRWPGSPHGSQPIAEADGTKPFGSSSPHPGRLAAPRDGATRRAIFGPACPLLSGVGKL